MAQIQVTNLTFSYEGSYDMIFDNVSFVIDTDWKLGFIGRNGKGKTTFLSLLLGKQEYAGGIHTSAVFDYFPYQVPDESLTECGAELLEQMKQGCELWRVLCELEALELDAEILYRPFDTLSYGERTKLMLAVLFSGENDFLLIDEPTNHLDQNARETVKCYLNSKKGYILVSHDRDLLDACIDHVLVLNRRTIEVQSGNFSSWWENKARKDAFSLAENEKHKKEIGKLNKASRRVRQWADQNEHTKIGFDPVKEHDRFKNTRSYIGAKTKKMQSRVKQMEERIDREIEEKEGLLQDIENPADLKLFSLRHHKEVLLTIKEYSLTYPDTKESVLQNLSMELRQGERVFLKGRNGCGKSTLIKAILKNADLTDVINGQIENDIINESGLIAVASGLTISYVNQDTSFLKGSVQKFCACRGLQESLFCAILRQLDMERVQFSKNMEDFSEGQKKKVLIAASLLTPAHLYIWDEPLNYIDVFSRMQIEKLILSCQPTMLIVEHDVRFREKIATEVFDLERV
ncbi:MAG: ATP-binding cassette domain-containing protein [Lachnospiraceae bacterium]|nr:ATP-binding cassette domain-containing protein [Lachnospiraceae bacterium]